MKEQLNPKEKELYRRTDEILHYLWDPIGVSDVPQARDECYSYLPRVFARLIENSKDHEIAAYLIKVEEGSMGMTSNKEKALKIAQILIEAKEWIVDEASQIIRVCPQKTRAGRAKLTRPSIQTLA